MVARWAHEADNHTRWPAATFVVACGQRIANWVGRLCVSVGAISWWLVCGQLDVVWAGSFLWGAGRHWVVLAFVCGGE